MWFIIVHFRVINYLVSVLYVYSQRFTRQGIITTGTTLHQDTFLLNISTAILIVLNINLFNNINDVHFPSYVPTK